MESFQKSFQYRNKIKKLNIEKLKIPREIKLELYFENRSFSKILEFFSKLSNWQKLQYR